MNNDCGKIFRKAITVLGRGENISKGGRSDITIEKLYSKIRSYKVNWSKHQDCLNILQEVL